MSKVNGFALATAAAVAFLAAPVGVANAGSHHSKQVACSGVNACKGHGSCKGANNACKGQNACKGRGFVDMTKAQCEQVGGSIAAPAAK